MRVLHLHNNHLTTLPDSLVALRCLNSLALAFNRFASLPLVAAQMTNIRLTDVECISLAGNQIERVSSEAVAEMKYARRLDLRLNSLTLPTTDTLKFTVLDRLTHLNVSDNRIAELDLHSLRSLEYLNCERNSMVGLHLNGAALRMLIAADNRK
jgi:PH domain/leucine-rich repeat-containing protein phosphatase